MAKQTIDIQQSAGENASRMNTNFGELYDGASALSQRATALEGRVTELEENPSAPSTVDTAECVEVPFTVESGRHLAASGGYAVSANSNITSPITVTNAAGKFLYMPEHVGGWDNVYTRYKPGCPADPANETAADVETYMSVHSWEGKPYLIIPIFGDSETYRIEIARTGVDTAKIYLVTKRWLKERNLITDWAGKKWLMFGDSYVEGHNIPGGRSYTWYNRFAYHHYTKFTNMGHNGIGLVRSPNIDHGLCGEIEEKLLDGNGDPLDLDAIGVCCGRNDYSAKVPIGTVDDMLELPDETNPYLHGDVTFMGGMNYICKWLHDNYTGKRFFFITPWNFLDDKTDVVAKPLDYVDAVKTIAGLWSIPCFDAARQSGISNKSDAFRTRYFLTGLTDASHLNWDGMMLMEHGPVAGWLENLFRD